jgi:hypothetical protein
MNSIADALVYAAAYIYCRATESEDSDEDEYLDNEDDSAIDHIMAYLSQATPEEENALANAAERALAEEKSLNSPKEQMIVVLSKWMELMLDRDWDGNHRFIEGSE